MDKYVNEMLRSVNGDVSHDADIYSRHICEITSKWTDGTGKLGVLQSYVHSRTYIMKRVSVEYPEFGKVFDEFLKKYDPGWIVLVQEYLIF